MSIFDNPLVEVLFPVDTIIAILQAFFPARVYDTGGIDSIFLLFFMTMLGVILIRLGERAFRVLVPITFATSLYWFLAHDSMLQSGTPDYSSAIIGGLTPV